MDGIGMGLAGFNKCVPWLSREFSHRYVFKGLGGSHFSI
jgi:hypothetical protein